MKLHLQSTDYGGFLSTVPSPLQVSVIDDKLKDKLVTEFQHMRTQATGPLATFLDYITYSYMIDNIILLITGTLHQVMSFQSSGLTRLQNGPAQP